MDPLAQGASVRGTAASHHQPYRDGRPVQLNGQGRFILGYDRDHGRSATLVARLGTGQEVRRQLDNAPRHWRIEHVDVARLPTAPTPKYLRLREGERARITADRARAEQSDGWRPRFIWPARGRISGVFRSQRV